MVSKYKKSGTNYIVVIALTVLFHVFNNLQINETIKLFHLFAIGTIVLGLFLHKSKTNIVNRSFALVIIWALVTSLLSPISASYLNMLKFLIISLSVLFLPYVSFDKLITYINIVIPIALTALIAESIRNFIYRFQGFYEDPNYFCTTLLVFYFYIQLYWNKTKKIWIKTLLLVEILLIAYLVAISISRTGMACFLLMTIAFWWEQFMKNKTKSVIAIFILLGCIYYFYKDMIDVAIEGYTMREESSNDSLGSASEHRWKISLSGLSFLFSHPLYWIQGIGIGTFRHGYELQGWHSYTNLIDHNTLTCWFTEQGIIGIILLFRFFALLCFKIYNSSYLKLTKLRIPCLSVFFVFLIFSASINQTTYFPFWFLLLTLVSISNETPKFSK